MSPHNPYAPYEPTGTAPRDRGDIVLYFCPLFTNPIQPVGHAAPGRGAGAGGERPTPRGLTYASHTLTPREHVCLQMSAKCQGNRSESCPSMQCEWGDRLERLYQTV